MRLKPFLLDMWLDTYEHDIEFNLAASEGPRWTLNEILELAGEEERERFLNHKLRYSRPAGAEGLRAAIAEMQDVNVETVQVVTGASEALLILFWRPPSLEPTLSCLNLGIRRFPLSPNRLGSRFAITRFARRTTSASILMRSSNRWMEIQSWS